MDWQEGVFVHWMLDSCKGPLQVRQGRLQVSKGVLKKQPAQDGQDVGGKRDAQPGAVGRSWDQMPTSTRAADARPSHVIHRIRRRGGTTTEGCRPPFGESLSRLMSHCVSSV